MAYRPQELVCYHINSGSDGSLFCKENKTGPAAVSVVNTLKYKERIVAEFPDITAESEVTRLSWIEVNGTTYKKNSVVVLGMDLVPRFGVVEEVHTDMYYLVCEVLITECLSHHFHSFQTCKQHPVEYVICKPANLYDHTVLAAYVIPTQRHLFHIPLKYQLIDDLLYM